MRPILDVVEAHRQKYRHSCSPSLIEMLLKIHGLVELDYYALQDQNQGSDTGLVPFQGRKIEGLKLHCHDVSTGQSFIEKLQELLKQGKIVGLYCRNNDGSCHGWLVNGVYAGRIHLLSKYSEEGQGQGSNTARVSFPLTGPGAIQITDLIYGQIQSP